MSKKKREDGEKRDGTTPGEGGSPATPVKAYIHIELDLVTGIVDINMSVPHVSTADYLLAEAKRGLDAEYARQQTSKSGLWTPPRPGIMR